MNFTTDPARRAALRDSWRALWLSRLLVWVAGVGTILAFGFGPRRLAFDPPGLTRGFGRLGDLLSAPAARWDASWYLVIAHFGYRPDLGSFTASRTAFFPLYPLLLRGLSELGLPAVGAGVLLSVGTLAAALYGIHRLATLEFGPPHHSREVARLAVLLCAFAPMAFFLSAVYSESLYLALSVGLFLCARRGRWAWVGALGALAAATRSAGVLLLLPALVLYFYGPREDRPPDTPRETSPNATGSSDPSRRERRWRPRYQLRPDALWLALVPAGLGAYLAYLGLSGGDPLLPFHAQDVWGRHFAGPFVGVWDGARAAFAGARQLLSGQTRHVYFPAAPGDPMVAAGHDAMLFVFLLLAVAASVGVLRRLPVAYGVYVLAALALPLSYPLAAQPLMSLPRFMLVLFPLFIWGGAWLAPRPRLARAALAGSALSLMFFVGEFSTWHWVA